MFQSNQHILRTCPDPNFKFPNIGPISFLLLFSFSHMCVPFIPLPNNMLVCSIEHHIDLCESFLRFIFIYWLFHSSHFSQRFACFRLKCIANSYTTLHTFIWLSQLVVALFLCSFTPFRCFSLLLLHLNVSCSACYFFILR